MVEWADKAPGYMLLKIMYVYINLFLKLYGYSFTCFDCLDIVVPLLCHVKNCSSCADSFILEHSTWGL